MDFGVGITQAGDGKNYVMLYAADGQLCFQVQLADQENYAENIDKIIRGLKQVKQDMKQAASGLVVAQEVPNGRLRPA